MDAEGRTYPRRFTPGERLPAKAVNFLLDSAGRANNLCPGDGILLKPGPGGVALALDPGRLRAMLPDLGETTWWGHIELLGPASEADYADCRYWVHSSYVSNTGADATARVTLTPYAATHPLHLHITATNMAERDLDSHWLPAAADDIYVLVHEVRDLSDPPTLLYWFDLPPTIYL